jgi:hypothetical protein
MTISSTTVKNSYSGDGSNDTFVYGFKIFASSDLQVIIRSATGTETTKTLTTDYTVTGVGTASGGNVVFEAAAIPTATETVVLIRNVPQTQAIDYIANDPFPAETHEEGLDRATMTIQQMQEEINRSIKLSKTNTMTSTEFAVAAADRANKILAFDSTGEISVTQELGTYKGTDTTVTTVAYVQRDIVKSTSAAQLNNVYICVGDSVVGDLLTDTDHFDLLVDAYSAAASEVAAAASAAAAQLSADDAAADLVLTNADVVSTNADVVLTNADVVSTNADAAATAADLVATNQDTIDTAADLVATNQDTIDTAADLVATNQDTIDTAADVVLTHADVLLTNADVVLTHADVVLTNADVVSTGLDKAATNADVLLTAADVISSAASAAAAAASADAFDDVYLGSKSSDPTTDNDGDPLAAGMLYYNSVSNIMRIYSGSAWENVAVSTAGFATLAGVETLTNKTLTAPKINENVAVTSTATELNLLDGVSGLVQADLTKLAAIDSTAAELNTLDALSRGSIIYGNASAATAILTKGTVGQVLTSDGTDIAWGDAASGLEWQSSIVTAATLTAVANEGYWIDTTSNACTITLPASASVGDQIIFVDYARKWGTNAITIDQNSLNFQGYSSPNPVYNTSGQSVSIVYSGATQGWIPISDDDVTNETIQPLITDFLVIAGGGGGGRGVGGGGGAGGYRNSYNSESSGGGGSAESSLTLTAGATYTITVGGGGTGGSSGTSPAYYGTNGSNSSISGTGITTITSIGGGGSGTQNTSPYVPNNGGSGGGGIGANSPSIPQTAGSGTANQGFDGGTGSTSAPDYCSGGGGGAGAIGGNASGTNGGNGGNGVASTITGSSVTRGGGGGGSGRNTGISGTGGTGGGGNGGTLNTPGTAGSTNTGGGGGGSHDVDGANGGKGVVILRMPDANYSTTTTGSPTVNTNVGGSGETVIIFNDSGSYTG